MNEIYCEEWDGDEPITLKKLGKLIPKLRDKYGDAAIVKFDAGHNNVSVMIQIEDEDEI